MSATIDMQEPGRTATLAEQQNPLDSCILRRRVDRTRLKAVHVKSGLSSAYSNSSTAPPQVCRYGHQRIWPTTSRLSILIVIMVALLSFPVHSSPLSKRMDSAALPDDHKFSISHTEIDLPSAYIDEGDANEQTDGVLAESSYLELKWKRQVLERAPLMTDKSNSTINNLPQPFDSNLGNNFTSSSCPELFNVMLTDPDFKDCVPVSLLLQVSHDHALVTSTVADHTLPRLQVDGSMTYDIRARSTRH